MTAPLRSSTSGWLGVASANHVQRGVTLSIAQINHGQRAGLARMHPGDTLIYYSSTQVMGVQDGYQHFTALGTIHDSDIWQADEGDFRPYRRRVEYLPTKPAPLAELRSRLNLTRVPNWGYQLRRGLVPLDAEDVAVIREAMQL